MCTPQKSLTLIISAGFFSLVCRGSIVPEQVSWPDHFVCVEQSTPNNALKYNRIKSSVVSDYCPWRSDIKSLYDLLPDVDSSFTDLREATDADLYAQVEFDSLYYFEDEQSNGYARAYFRAFFKLTFEDVWGRQLLTRTFTIQESFTGYGKDLNFGRRNYEYLDESGMAVLLVELLRVEVENRADSVKRLSAEPEPIPFDLGSGDPVSRKEAQEFSMIASNGDIALTAFLFSREGYFFTDNRLFGDEDTISMIDVFEVKHTGKLVREYKRFNLALGRIDGYKTDKCPRVAKEWAPQYLAQVYLYGSSGRFLGQTYTTAEVTGISLDWFTTDVTNQLSFSGSGIMSDKNEFVGMCIAESVNYNNSLLFTNYPIVQCFNWLNLKK